MTRRLALATALVFTVFFAILTVSVIVNHGLSVAVVLAILIIVLFFCGILGALRNPPK